MKVKELIRKLNEMPPDAEVKYIWDGVARTKADLTWLSRGGDVMICGYEELVYPDEERPIEAPSETDDPYWYSPDARI